MLHSMSTGALASCRKTAADLAFIFLIAVMPRALSMCHVITPHSSRGRRQEALPSHAAMTPSTTLSSGRSALPRPSRCTRHPLVDVQTRPSRRLMPPRSGVSSQACAGLRSIAAHVGGLARGALRKSVYPARRRRLLLVADSDLHHVAAMSGARMLSVATHGSVAIHGRVAATRSSSGRFVVQPPTMIYLGLHSPLVGGKKPVTAGAEPAPRVSRSSRHSMLFSVCPFVLPARLWASLKLTLFSSALRFMAF